MEWGRGSRSASSRFLIFDTLFRAMKIHEMSSSQNVEWRLCLACQQNDSEVMRAICRKVWMERSREAKNIKVCVYFSRFINHGNQSSVLLETCAALGSMFYHLEHTTYPYLNKWRFQALFVSRTSFLLSRLYIPHFLLWKRESTIFYFLGSVRSRSLERASPQ